MPFTPEQLAQMAANPHGSLGQATSTYDINALGDRSGQDTMHMYDDPRNRYTFTQNGQQYQRMGQPWQELYGGNNTQFFQGDPSTYGAYDPQYGYGLRGDIYEGMRGAGARANAEGANRYLTYAPIALGMLGMGAAMGGAFPGIDAAGNALSAGQTGIMSGWGGTGATGGTPGGGAVGGGHPDSYWSMMADASGAGGTATDAAAAGAGSVGPGGSPFTGEWANVAGGAGGSSGAIPGGAGAGANPFTGEWANVAGGASTSGSGNFLGSIANALGLGSGPGSGLSALGMLTSGLGGLGQVIGATTAARTAADAQRDATQAQLGMFNTINQQQAPYRQAGYNALGSIMGGMGLGPATGGVAANQFTRQFTNADLNAHMAPNWEFQRDQGLRATTNQLNRLGGMASGNTLQGINDYAQNFAGNAYQNAFSNYQGQNTNIFNRLNSIAGLGQTANAATGNAGAQMSGGIANSIVGAGNAQAAGQMGIANAMTSAGNNAMGWYALPQLLNWGGGGMNG